MDEDSEGSDSAADEAIIEDSDLASDNEELIDQDEEMEEATESDEEDDKEDTADKLNKDIDQHRKDMEALKEKDPEFYEFLRKEDEGLLDFDESDHSEEEDEEEKEEESDVEENHVPILTKAKLNEWIEKIKSTKDFKAFKSLLTAFKTAARMSEENDKITFAVKIEDPTGIF
jgi:nucleolar complex protein 2